MVRAAKTSLRLLSDTTGKVLQSISESGTIVGTAGTGQLSCLKRIFQAAVCRGAPDPGSGDPDAWRTSLAAERCLRHPRL